MKFTFTITLLAAIALATASSILDTIAQDNGALVREAKNDKLFDGHCDDEDYDELLGCRGKKRRLHLTLEKSWTSSTDGTPIRERVDHEREKRRISSRRRTRHHAKDENARDRRREKSASRSFSEEKCEVKAKAEAKAKVDLFIEKKHKNNPCWNIVDAYESKDREEEADEDFETAEEDSKPLAKRAYKDEGGTSGFIKVEARKKKEIEAKKEEKSCSESCSFKSEKIEERDKNERERERKDLSSRKRLEKDSFKVVQPHKHRHHSRHIIVNAHDESEVCGLDIRKGDRRSRSRSIRRQCSEESSHERRSFELEVEKDRRRKRSDKREAEIKAKKEAELKFKKHWKRADDESAPIKESKLRVFGVEPKKIIKKLELKRKAKIEAKKQEERKRERTRHEKERESRSCHSDSNSVSDKKSFSSSSSSYHYDFKRIPFRHCKNK